MNLLFSHRSLVRTSFILCAFTASTLAACGGDDAAPITDLGVRTDTGTGEDMSVPIDQGMQDDASTPDDAGSDASDLCATAVDGATCTMAGATCGGPCVDHCNFCNILRCEGGMWTAMEIFPDPTCATTFPCDTAGLRCDRNTEFCSISRSDVPGEPDVIRCDPVPSTCTTVTCACFASGVGMTCTDDAAGGVTVTYLGG